MNEPLKPGLRYSKTIKVDRSLIVPEMPKAIGALDTMPPVLATAYMIAFVETACIEALAPYLGENQMTVGTHVDMSHLAATPAGMSITVDLELILVEGRKLRFRVACRDDAEPIGAGFHERAIIDGPKFKARVQAKSEKGAG